MLRSITILFLFMLLMLGYMPEVVSGQSAEDLRRQIEERNKLIEELEKDIVKNEQQLAEVAKEKQTLENAVKTLDISRQKVATDINLTEEKIDTTIYRIQTLEEEIAEKEAKIMKNREAVAESIRGLHKNESQTLVETVLAYNTLSEVWDDVETLERFQLVLRDEVTELSLLKDELEGKKNEEHEERVELEGYKKDLSGKKQVLDQNRNEKDQLLSVTKSEEAKYQQLLAEKRAAREEFLRELQNLEQELQFTLDPDSIPTAGKGILGWPLDGVRITQYFGNTAFAKSGAYNGSGHNGIDFGASSGTRVKAALSGVVAGTGNTDAIPGCYSYGKWVLIKHNNGLSSLYAHLSVISVSSGQVVTTGEAIGYSGNTGYSTGPHLHFSVYLTEAVQVRNIGDWYRQNGQSPTTACAKGGAIIPVAPLNSYLNPLDYLPAS